MYGKLNFKANSFFFERLLILKLIIHKCEDILIHVQF